MLLRKHGNAIQLILVSTDIENMTLEEFLEEIKDSSLDHIPIIIIYKDEIDMLDSLMERGVSECLTHNMPAGLFRSKVDTVLQLNWYKNRYQNERLRRNSLEKEFTKLFALTGLSREQLASDLQQVGKAWDTPSQVIEKTKQELSSKGLFTVNSKYLQFR
jgi:PleD family two-component response regulator